MGGDDRDSDLAADALHSEPALGPPITIGYRNDLGASLRAGYTALFLLTIGFAAFLYARGEHAALWLNRFGHRLAGARGEHSIRLAGQAVRGVAFGVVVTAVVLSVAGGVGLAVAGIPYAAVLTAVMFMLAIAQVGPLLVLIPSVLWLFWSSQPGWATFLLVWTLVIVAMAKFCARS